MRVSLRTQSDGIPDNFVQNSETDHLPEKAQALALTEPVSQDGGQSEGQLVDLPADQEWVWG